MNDHVKLSDMKLAEEIGYKSTPTSVELIRLGERRCAHPGCPLPAAEFHEHHIADDDIEADLASVYDLLGMLGARQVLIEEKLDKILAYVEEFMPAARKAQDLMTGSPLERLRKGLSGR